MLEILDEAKAEVRSAANRYRDQRPELAAAFLKSVREAYGRVAATPDAWPIWEMPGPELGVRRARLLRFPHRLLYVTEPRLVVIAVMHPRREPTYWIRRLSTVRP